MWHLSKDVYRAVDTVLALPKFAYLGNRFGDRRNPLAARLHYALASVEDAILSSMEDQIKKIPTATVNTLMFDGMVLFVQEEEEGRVTDALAAVGKRWKVSFSVDKW